ncbi:MAG: carbohydrate ABC transporter permease [Sulfobacillus benefaciens]|uniref:Carbohydrate ABC transporter permease n=1 Tax=Sulfobacillus benefaciens TaxID=453960 RepID=A0A2T2XDN2_9FIRM|nr:MAG: carbohydrate ABC transporter permease [Sulfobacillus benefaciens]
MGGDRQLRHGPGSHWGSYIFLVASGGVVLLPILWMVMGSVESTTAMFTGHIIPPRLDFANYPHAWASAPFARYFLNSFGTTIAIVFFQVATSALAAYGVVFTTIRGRNVAFGLILLSMMIPIQAIFIPDYILLSDLHWINTYQALVIPFVGTGFGVFFLRQAYLKIPREMVEAMKMDGGSHWAIFQRLVLPNTVPSMITLALLNGAFHYGYLFWPLLVTESNAYRVVPVGLAYFLAQDRGIHWNQLMAANIMTVIPPIVAFILGQRYIVKGVLSYGSKG